MHRSLPSALGFALAGLVVVGAADAGTPALTFIVRATFLEVRDWPPPGRNPWTRVSAGELWRHPEAARTILGQQQVMVRSGETAFSQAVVEIIHPKLFRDFAHPWDNRWEDTREVGHILNLMPTSRAGVDEVELSAMWETMALVGAMPGLPMEGLTLPFPVFATSRWVTTITLRPGAALAIRIGAAGEQVTVPGLALPPPPGGPRFVVLHVERIETVRP